MNHAYAASVATLTILSLRVVRKIRHRIALQSYVRYAYLLPSIHRVWLTHLPRAARPSRRK